MKLSVAQIRELGKITTYDESGTHFTAKFDHYEALESAGLLKIHRPVHEQTGIPYDSQYWSVEVTDDGQDVVDAHPELF